MKWYVVLIVIFLVMFCIMSGCVTKSNSQAEKEYYAYSLPNPSATLVPMTQKPNFPSLTDVVYGTSKPTNAVVQYGNGAQEVYRSDGSYVIQDGKGGQTVRYSDGSYVIQDGKGGQTVRYSDGRVVVQDGKGGQRIYYEK